MRPRREKKINMGREQFQDQTLSCWHKKRDVVIRINVNGLAVCREWKGCEDQGGIGCPEKFTRDNIRNLIREARGLPEEKSLQRMVIDAFRKLKEGLSGG